ncbi:MAG TPA: 30S ribosomal protein S12 methylthiotransferase RimO [Candidatus Eisenbacteria bacterium]|nr:30S ribosomal protein S12 methylthiotransferase RimO [Candidatus Eisenbacteria bacterium]
MKNENLKERPVRVGLISLGCAKNLADAEIMLGTLLKDGIEITNNASEADVVIVNTCSFIDSAQEESVDAILESAELREVKNRGQGLIVSGCLPQRFREDLPKLLPEVDAFMGIDQVSSVTDIVHGALHRRREKLKVRSVTKTYQAPKLPKLKLQANSKSRIGSASVELPATSAAASVEVTPRPNYIPDYATPRFRLTPRHFAYLKIAEGCNHPCSFCIIPRMRGSHRSRRQADVVAEARALIADGVKELNLISQDSTYYGLDLRPNHRPSISSPDKFNAAVKALPVQATTICTLLRELNALEGDFWVRLLYTHPAHWTDELIQTIAECRKVARYVDIPLQHIHENMLERMRRETSQQHIAELVRRMRAGIPGIALRTTFIVGFPGETEACFETLLDFIRETKFERLGVFTYSQQEGTRAGGMAGQIPDRVKKQRRALAMGVQHKVAVQVAQSFVGRTLRVLVEKEASTKEIKSARLHSWEHGLIRGEDRHASQLKGRYLVARGEADAPDIDGRVYVRGKLPLGDFAEVRIIGHTDYDLIATD